MVNKCNLSNILNIWKCYPFQFSRKSVMAIKTLFSGAIVQIQNNIASMFHTLTQKSCRAEVESVGGFQPKNVSNNLNVKLLLIQNVDNVILGDVTMDLQLVQQTLVELTFQVWVGSTIVYFKLNITMVVFRSKYISLSTPLFFIN